jgi:protein TonB
MGRARWLIAESWAPSASILLHGLGLVALLMAVKPPAATFPTSQEQAVPVTLVTLAQPKPQPISGPVVAPPPPVMDEPPPVTTTSQAVAEIAPPHKPLPKKRPQNPKPQPNPQVKKPDPAPIAPAPVAPAPAAAPIGPAPQPSQSAGPSPSYLALLRQKLERNKVYPHTARARKEQGTALLRFVIDRSGHVLNHRLDRSTGHRDLDREVEAMLDRAQPLPPMPAEMTQAQIELVVPVQFHLR